VILLLSLLLNGAWSGGPPPTDGKPRLVARVSPQVALSQHTSRGWFAAFTVHAGIAGPESESHYCLELVFIAPNGTESKEEADCPPFADRHTVPPVPPECLPKITGGQLITPQCAWDERVAYGYLREFSPRRYYLPQCPDQESSCEYQIIVELRRGGQRVKDGSVSLHMVVR